MTRKAIYLLYCIPLVMFGFGHSKAVLEASTGQSSTTVNRDGQAKSAESNAKISSLQQLLSLPKPKGMESVNRTKSNVENWMWDGLQRNQQMGIDSYGGSQVVSPQQIFVRDGTIRKVTDLIEWATKESASPEEIGRRLDTIVIRPYVYVNTHASMTATEFSDLKKKNDFLNNPEFIERFRRIGVTSYKVTHEGERFYSALAIRKVQGSPHSYGAETTMALLGNKLVSIRFDYIRSQNEDRELVQNIQSWMNMVRARLK